MEDKFERLTSEEIIGRGDIIVRIRARIGEEITSTEWYQHQPIQFDLVRDYDRVKAICGENVACLMDSFNWTVMNKTELTSMIYKFITHRVYVVKQGFAKEAQHLSQVNVVDNFVKSLKTGVVETVIAFLATLKVEALNIIMSLLSLVC